MQDGQTLILGLSAVKHIAVRVAIGILVVVSSVIVMLVSQCGIVTTINGVLMVVLEKKGEFGVDHATALISALLVGLVWNTS